MGRFSLCDIIDRWYDQIAVSPVLKLFGAGLANSATSSEPRLAELTDYVFDRLSWESKDFVGYRCEEEFPLWGCDYVMAFDYRREWPSGA